MFPHRDFRTCVLAAAMTASVGLAAAASAQARPLPIRAIAAPHTVPAAGSIVLLHSFAGVDGQNPQGGLQYAFTKSGGKLLTTLYGTAQSGGDANGDGTIFAQGVLGSTPFATVFSFNGANGSAPSGGLSGIFNNYALSKSLFGVTANGGAHGLGAIYEALPNGAQAVLYSFTGWGDGANPVGRLVFRNGSLYGTTSAGAGGFGTVFRYSLEERKFKTLHVFKNSNDGATPLAGLAVRLSIPAADGKARSTARNGRAIDTSHADDRFVDRDLYGTTSAGGAGGLGNGTIFKISPEGTLTTLVTFTNADPGTPGIPGATPQAELVSDFSGNLYGSTFNGGSAGFGELFVLSAKGAFSVLHDFAFDAVSGAEPTGANPLAPLTLLFDGSIYGTTSSGSAFGLGNIFQISPAGSFTLKYEFSGPDGALPAAPLIDGFDGNLYSTTSGGGANGLGEIFAIPE